MTKFLSTMKPSQGGCLAGVSPLTEHRKTLKKKGWEQEDGGASLSHIHTRLLAPGTQNQRHSSALPSFLAQPNEMPSIFPSALFLLFAEENTTGPKRCRLPQALAALLANRQILHVQCVPECTELRPEGLATGPSSGRVKAEKKIISLGL